MKKHISKIQATLHNSIPKLRELQKHAEVDDKIALSNIIQNLLEILDAVDAISDEYRLLESKNTKTEVPNITLIR